MKPSVIVLSFLVISSALAQVSPDPVQVFLNKVEEPVISYKDNINNDFKPSPAI